MKEREWQQFHSAKNLSMSIAAEAAELMEIFLWAESNTVDNVVKRRRTEVEHEVSDVAILLINFCTRYNIDLSKAIEQKMQLNGQRYPVANAKGKAIKYGEL